MLHCQKAEHYPVHILKCLFYYKFILNPAPSAIFSILTHFHCTWPKFKKEDSMHQQYYYIIRVAIYFLRKLQGRENRDLSLIIPHSPHTSCTTEDAILTPYWRKFFLCFFSNPHKCLYGTMWIVLIYNLTISLKGIESENEKKKKTTRNKKQKPCHSKV